MDDYEVGFGKPPKHTRFKPGTSGNPKGRPKRSLDPLGDEVKAVLEATIGYRENGQPKSATRTEVRLKTLLARAIKGDVKAAGTLLDERRHALKNGEAGELLIVVEDALPEDLRQVDGAQDSESLLCASAPDQSGG